MIEKIVEVAKESVKKISDNIPEFGKEKKESTNVPDFLKTVTHGIVRSEVDKETEDEKVKEKTNYSDDINDYIITEEELDVYQNEGLEEGKVNDRITLKDTNIDPDLVDSKGRTNLERMEKGLAPLDEDGKPYNLHHIGQKSDSPLAELKDNVHKKNDSALHDKTQKTEVHNENSEVNWDKERSDHWKARAEEMKKERDLNV